LEGWLNKFRHTTKFWAVDLHLNPYMKGMLTKGVFSQQLKWMFKYRLRLNIIDDQTLSMNDYRFALTGSDVDITEPIMLNQSIDDAIKVYNLRLAEMESEDQRDISKLDIYKKEEEAPAPTPAKPERRVIQMPTPAPKPAAQAPAQAQAQAKPQPKPAPAPKPVAAKPEPKPQPAPQPKAEVKSEPKPEKQPDPALANLPQAIDVARAYKSAKDNGTAYVAPLPAPVAAPAPVPVPAAEVVTEEPAVAIAQPSEETKAAVAAVITKVVAAKKKPAPKKKAEDATEAESDMATDEPAKPKVQRRPATKPKVTPKKRGSDDDMPVDPDELA
ncbi:MAG: hypothetical protein RL177_1342, partial [Bacteroidota bacterium]